MLILDGKPLSYDRAFSHAGISYPANWLRLSTLEEKQRIGITEVPDPATWDQRFYWGVDNPKDHTGLVELWVSQVKETAGTLLSPTDWYITRKSETGAAIPQEVLDRRTEIRAYSNQKEAAIESTTTTAELVAYVTSTAFGEWAPPAVVEETSESSESTESSTDEEVVVFSSSSTSSAFGSSDTLISD